MASDMHVAPQIFQMSEVAVFIIFFSTNEANTLIEAKYSEIDLCQVCHHWVLNQGDLLGSVFAEVAPVEVDSVELAAELDPVELAGEVDSVELEADVDSVELLVLFRHSSSSSTAITHL